MEAAKNVFYSPLIYTPKTRGRKFSPSTSVQMINDETTVVVTSTSTTSIAQHFPASVFLQDHDLKTSLPFGREDRTVQASSERSLIDRAVPSCEQKKSDRYLKDFQRQLLYWPGVCYLLPPIHSDEKPLSSLRESTSNVADKVADIKLESMGSRHLDSAEPWNALTLAKEAVMASKEAAFLAENFGALNESLSPGLEHWVGQFNLEEVTVVRSQRHLERQSKKRKAPNKLNVEHSSRRVKDSGTKIDARSLNSTDPFKFFLFSHETKRLLTAKEEHDLFVQIKYLMKLEEVKGKLRAQFGHEPTLVEWAEAVGMSCRALQACMNSGNNSREKMIYANFRLVVHVAKKYQGSGLGIHDLLQVGSMGLMKGLEKFKPQAGCRFSTYAYWWIRQSIKKAIFLHSRTIRLPENVYALLKRVNVAKKSFIQKGHFPSNEDLAKSLGISVVKLERLLFTTQKPVSIQQPAWGSDQDVTFQEITADPADEILSITVDKQLMRRHVRNLLTTLTPKERQVVLLRYGIHDGEKKSLSEIGRVFGISKERVRQVENRAIEKLKKFLSSEGLEVYVDLIT